MIEKKTCTKCNETKTVDLFYKRSDKLGKYTSHCRACKRAHDNAHCELAETKAKRAEYLKNLRSTPEYKAKEAAYKKAYYRTNEYRQRARLKQRVRRLDPNVLQKEKLYGAIYAKTHPEKFAMKTRKRKIAKMNRTPAWLNAGEEFEIECIYKYCASLRQTGLDCEVDHIVPLQGKSVSGLHVPWNLQVLTASENASKGNRVW
jgi:hypothetical protein